MNDHPCRNHTPRRRWTFRVIVILTLCLGWWSVMPGRAGKSDTPRSAHPAFRVAFSSNLFTEINVNDARAAVKVWAETVAKEHDILCDPNPQILEGTESIIQALQNREADAVSILFNEYWRLRQQVKLGNIFVGLINGALTEEYVLLVHQESGIQNLPDLRGGKLVLFENPRMCLALPWLDLLLNDKALGRAAEFFGNQERIKKLSPAVLRVFFRQADAGVVTRSGYKTLMELNPQLGKQLRVLASPPAVVPVVMCFPEDYASPQKEQIFSALEELQKTPAGTQVLTMFKCDKLVQTSTASLDASLELLSKHEGLTAQRRISEAAKMNPNREGKGESVKKNEQTNPSWKTGRGVSQDEISKE